MSLRSRTTWFIAASVLFLSGCGTVRIGRILDEPTRYRDRTVRVSGRVDSSFGAMATGLYRVNDGTGTIYVLSNRGVPRSGTSVTVKGRVQSGITVGSHSYGAAIREEGHRVHY
jgi:hypothetical protein